MKFLFLVAFLSIATLSCVGDSTKNAADEKKAHETLSDTANYTSIQWIDSLYDFGSVAMGAQVNMTFHFKNTGNKPLIITDARPGCGCTVASFTKQAIPPGGQGEVSGTYDSNRGSVGTIHKVIYVTANTKHNTQHILVFSGQVTEKKG